MPTYDYLCQRCNEQFEVFQTFEEKPLTRHRGGCGGKVSKVLAPVGVVLKGSGFYKTDSQDSARSKSKAASTSTTKEKTSDSSATTESKTAEPSSGDGTSDSKSKSTEKKKSPKSSSGGSSSE